MILKKLRRDNTKTDQERFTVKMSVNYLESNKRKLKSIKHAYISLLASKNAVGLEFLFLFILDANTHLFSLLFQFHVKNAPEKIGEQKVANESFFFFFLF